MRYLFLIVSMLFFICVNCSAFAEVCLKNDTYDVILRGREADGSMNKHPISEGNIFVLQNDQPQITMVDFFGSDHHFDDFGRSLQDGDMVHIGGTSGNLYVSWVEQGNCNQRAPTN